MIASPLCLACALSLLFAAVPPVAAGDTWEWLIPGVQHLHRTTATPWEIHVVKADLSNPRVRVRTIIKNDNDYPDAGEVVSSMAGRYSAVAAINTDYFCMTYSACPNVWHCPQGYTVTDGLSHLPPGYSSPINGLRTTFQLSKSQDQAVIDKVTSPQSWWFNVTGGGPRIVRDGQVSVESEPDVPSQTTREPRTGCALSADGRTLILATVDGRQPGWSVGMTGAELAALLIEMGGYQGMSFDGGGSTTMVINGSVANRPSGGTERYVAASLAIIDAFAQPANAADWFETGFANPPYAPGSICGVHGWTCESGQPTIGQASSNLTPQALVLADAAAYRNVTSSPVTGVQWVDCYAKAPTTPVDGVIEIGATPLSGAAALIGFRPNGKISYFEGNRSGGGTWKDLSTYLSNRWYRVSVRLDYYKQSYAFYLNDYLRASGVAFRDASASSGLRSIRFGDFAAAGGEFHIDDVYVGNIDPWFPRVTPDTARIIIPGPKQFTLRNGPAASWQVVDEKDPSGDPAAPGTVAAISGDGLLTAFAPGSCKVRATDVIGRTDDSSTIEVVAKQSVSAARAMPLGSAVDLAELVVTGVFDGFFYAQELDRSAGIVVLSSVSVGMSQKVALTGVTSCMGGELAVAASWVEATSAVSAPVPLVLTCRDVLRQNPCEPTAAVGCSAAALLVTIAGRVQSVEADRFCLDDGSGAAVPVIHSGLSGSSVGRVAVATGLVAASGGSPAIRTRGSGDVVLLPQ